MRKLRIPDTTPAPNASIDARLIWDIAPLPSCTAAHSRKSDVPEARHPVSWRTTRIRGGYRVSSPSITATLSLIGPTRVSRTVRSDPTDSANTKAAACSDEVSGQDSRVWR